MTRTSFATSTRGLDRASHPMRLYEKAKRLGIWNPSEIELTRDRRDWAALSAVEQDLILRLLAMFVAGEEAVTLDLLPLIQVIAREGRLEEEMFLTSFLYEEAKHTDFFRRFIDEILPSPVGGRVGGGIQHAENATQPPPYRDQGPRERSDLSKYHTDNYRAIFYDALPAALSALTADSAPAAQIRAAVTYNMIVEGVLAETGYHAFYTMLERNDIMPGLRKGIGLLKQDESRHIAYGIYLLSRLVAENPDEWDTLETHMNALLPAAIGVIGDAFAAYEVVPFGLVEEDFINYAMDQFSARFARLEKARGVSMAEVNRVAEEAEA